MCFVLILISLIIIRRHLYYHTFKSNYMRKCARSWYRYQFSIFKFAHKIVPCSLHLSSVLDQFIYFITLFTVRLLKPVSKLYFANIYQINNEISINTNSAYSLSITQLLKYHLTSEQMKDTVFGGYVYRTQLPVDKAHCYVVVCILNLKLQIRPPAINKHQIIYAKVSNLNSGSHLGNSFKFEVQNKN